MKIINDNFRLMVIDFFANENNDYIIFEINNLIGRINHWKDGSFEGEILDNPDIDYPLEFWNELECDSSFGYRTAEEAFNWIEDESKKYLKYFK